MVGCFIMFVFSYCGGRRECFSICIFFKDYVFIVSIFILEYVKNIYKQREYGINSAFFIDYVGFQGEN